MATVDNDKYESSGISSEAYELLDGFVGSLDDVIYSIAEQIAMKRHPDFPASGESIIEVEDIKEAANHLLDALRPQVETGSIPFQVFRLIEKMVDGPEASAREYRK